jgi:hypothetical protein
MQINESTKRQVEDVMRGLYNDGVQMGKIIERLAPKMDKSGEVKRLMAKQDKFMKTVQGRRRNERVNE